MIWIGDGRVLVCQQPRPHFKNSYTLCGRGGLQGMDRAVTTCRLPLNRGIGMHPPGPLYPSTMLTYNGPTQVPPGPRPYGSTGKRLGHTRRHDETPYLDNSILIHLHSMND